LIDVRQEITMLKTISAALLAVSMLAAPAMAVGTAKTAAAPVIKSVQVKKAVQVKPSVLNANARMGRHHRHLRHHRFHKRMGALKTHHFSKAGFASADMGRPASNVLQWPQAGSSRVPFEIVEKRIPIRPRTV
jgi:hypothetical protein